MGYSKYKVNQLERNAISQLQKTGAVRIICKTASQAKYQKVRLRSIFNRSGIGTNIATSHKDNIIFVWVRSFFPATQFFISDDIILESSKVENTFRQEDIVRDKSKDISSLQDILIEPATPIKAGLKRNLIKFINKRLTEGKITPEQANEALKQVGVESIE